MKKICSNNRIIICMAIVAIVAVTIIGTGTTLAVLRVQVGVITNSFKSAKINVQVEEHNSSSEKNEGSDTKNEIDFGSIEKNESINKVVWIKNIDSLHYPTTDTFVRCRVIPILLDQEGNNIAKNVIFSISGQASDWIIDADNNYYYYTKILSKGGKTSNLFESIQVESDIPTGAVLEIQVLVDAVQARPFAENFNTLSEEKKSEIPSYDAWKWYYDISTETLKKE